jgi:hypothetical protein
MGVRNYEYESRVSKTGTDETLLSNTDETLLSNFKESISFSVWRMVIRFDSV